MARAEHQASEEPTPDERTSLIPKATGDPAAIKPAGGDTGVDTENGSQAPYPESADQVPLADEPSTGRLLLIMSGCWLGSFLAALDSTVIATLSGPISTSFNSLSLLSWLASAYFIANAALQPLSGKLTDILGRRTGLVFSNVSFAAGNLICGLARSEGVIIFGRVVAGMGGGGLNAISTFLASDLIPLRRRGVWQGFGNISYGLGATLGGVVGGWINDTYGWRMAFYVQVPFTFVSCLLVVLNVRVPVQKSTRPTWRRIDFSGAFLLIVTLVLLLLGLNSGGNLVPWTHPLVLVTLPLSLICLIAFVLVEDRTLEPVIPVRLLLHRTVIGACLTNWFITMAQFSILFYGPLYFQIKGLSTTKAGLLLIPQSCGTAVGSVTIGLVMRWLGKYYWLSAAVISLFVLGQLLAATTFTLYSTPLWEIILAFFLCGLGYSGMLTTMLIAVISAVEHQFQAVITSATYAFRSTGSAIGITIGSAVFQNVLHARLEDVLAGYPGDGAGEIISRLKDSLDVLKTLPQEWQGPVRGAYMDALKAVFVTQLGVSVLGGLVSLTIREHKLFSSLSRK